ncbi:hypothetical protein [Staphylococcus epidermidis]|jgi:hypothetical protein|uniref:hypothetical protein n=1 Tax=Staphylococcus epidermidis TaxID=1282 RepID=UPI002AAE2A20|nr:hypothetical protein ScKU71_19870 [Streptococcus canis]
MKLYILISVLAITIGCLYAYSIDFIHGVAITALIQTLTLPIVDKYEYKKED